MPITTKLAWTLGAEQGEAKEGKLDILLNHFFVNGVKRRRVTDLSTLPVHDGFGDLHLVFNCGGEIRATLRGGAMTCKAFIEDCMEVLQKQTGKRTIDMSVSPQTSLSPNKRAKIDMSVSSKMASSPNKRPKTDMSCCGKDCFSPPKMPSPNNRPTLSASRSEHVPQCSGDSARSTQRDGNVSVTSAASVTSVAEELMRLQTDQIDKDDRQQQLQRQHIHTEEASAEDMAMSSTVAACMQTAMEDLSETAPSRSFLVDVCANLKKGSVAEAVIKACSSLDGQTAAREEAHRTDKRTLRLEVAESNSRCDRIVRGREALEKQMKVLCAQLNALKDVNQNLERHARGERTHPQPRPATKRAKGAAKGCPSSADPEDDFIRSLVAHEVGPLQQCSGDERDALKKKILLKWHPDKQPSEAHKKLATQVMQELMNSVAWAARGS